MKDAKGHGSDSKGAHAVTVDQLGHSALTIPGGYIQNDVRDSYHGDVYGSIEAIVRNQRVGKIDYASSGADNKTAVHMIETTPEARHHGIATHMMDRLKAEFPGRVVKWGGTTPEGEAFKRAYYGSKK